MPAAVFWGIWEKLIHDLVKKILSQGIRLPTTASSCVSVFVVLSVWLGSSLLTVPSTGKLEDYQKK